MIRSRSIVLALAFTLPAIAPFGCAGTRSADPSMAEHIVKHPFTEQDLATTRSGAPIESDSAVLWVNGMGCPLCASNIDKQLERVKGVSKVNVDLGQGKVTLALTPNTAHPSPARLSTAVEDAGFTLVKVDQQ